MLIRICSSYFVAGIIINIIDDEYYNNCAPIIKYMKTWSPGKIRNYCKYKNWRYESYD